MSALLHNLTRAHNKDAIGFTYGRESVGDYKAGSALHHTGKCLLDKYLGTGIYGGSSFIENKHRRQ
jgi:hypothetical protein